MYKRQVQAHDHPPAAERTQHALGQDVSRHKQDAEADAGDDARKHVHRLHLQDQRHGDVLFLLQKREENELSQAFTAYNTRIVTPPPVSYTHLNPFYKLPYETGKTKYRYVVTALDRLHKDVYKRQP